MKSVVVVSSLTVRFYKKEGWTLDILKKFITGDIIDSEVVFNDASDCAYFTLDLNTKIDLDALYPHISSLKRLYNDYPLDDDYTFLAKHLGIYNINPRKYGKILNLTKALEQNADK